MPDVAVKAVVDIGSAAREWQRFLDKLRETYTTTAKIQDGLKQAEQAVRQYAAANQRNTQEAREALKQWRGLTDIYHEDVAALKELEKQQQATAKAGSPEQVQGIIDANKKLFETYKQQYTTIEEVENRLKELRSELNSLRNSEESGTAAVQDGIQKRQNEVGVLEQVRSGLIAKRNAEEEATRAQEQHTQSIVHWIKQAIKFTTITASLYYAYRKVVNAAVDLAKEMLKDTDEAKALDAATVNLKASLYAAFGDEVLQAARELADIINDIAGFVDNETAIYRMRNTLYETAKQQRAAGTLTTEAAGQQLLDELTKGYGALGFEEEQLHKLALTLGYTEEEYNRLTNATRDSIEAAKADFTARNAEADALREVASAAEELTDFYRDLVEAEREAAAAAADAQSAYAGIAGTYSYNAATGVGTQLTPGTALGNLAAEQMRIQRDLADQISAINASAEQQRVQAYANYYSQLRNLQRQAQRQEEDAARQHQLEMEYMQKRYQLDVLQNERIYEYNRRQLVAEGDVLAIEDLDARYQLERQAAEENYELQREQSEAMYRLQAEMLAEAMADQISALKDALQQQLLSIEESRQEQIADAQAAAAERQQQAQEAYAQELADAKAALEEQKAEQAAAEAERLQKTAEFLAEFAIKHNLTAAEVVKIWQNATGSSPQGLLGLTQQAYDEIKKLTTAFEQQLTPALGAAGENAGAAFRNKLVAEMQLAAKEVATIASQISNTLSSASASGSGYNPYNLFPSSFGGTTYTPRTNYFQHGGEMIVSQPTHFVAGEGNSPERVTVQPLSPIGGSIGVSWRGGPISVNGSGFGGADASTITSVFNQMLQGFALEYIKQRSSIRGQRGR